MGALAWEVLAVPTMPLIGLYFKANMTANIEKIEFPEDHEWTLDVQQSGGAETKERVTLSQSGEFDVPNSGTTANFVVKWGGSKHGSTMNVVTKSRNTAKELKGLKSLNVYENSDGGAKEVPIVVFDCRGMEPIKWYPVGPYKVVAKS